MRQIEQKGTPTPGTPSFLSPTVIFRYSTLTFANIPSFPKYFSFLGCPDRASGETKWLFSKFPHGQNRRASFAPQVVPGVGSTFDRGEGSQSATHLTGESKARKEGTGPPSLGAKLSSVASRGPISFRRSVPQLPGIRYTGGCYPCRLLYSSSQSARLMVTSQGSRLRRWNTAGMPSWNFSLSRLA